MHVLMHQNAPLYGSINYCIKDCYINHRIVSVIINTACVDTLITLNCSLLFW